MKYYYVELIRMKLGVLTMEPVDEEFRLFSSMRLVKNGLLIMVLFFLKELEEAKSEED